MDDTTDPAALILANTMTRSSCSSFDTALNLHRRLDLE